MYTDHLSLLENENHSAIEFVNFIFCHFSFIIATAGWMKRVTVLNIFLKPNAMFTEK